MFIWAFSPFAPVPSAVLPFFVIVYVQVCLLLSDSLCMAGSAAYRVMD